MAGRRWWGGCGGGLAGRAYPKRVVVNGRCQLKSERASCRRFAFKTATRVSSSLKTATKGQQFVQDSDKGQQFAQDSDARVST